MPYAPHGTLADQIFQNRHFITNPSHVKPFFQQMVSATSFCHANAIAHCDLKPENILCSSDQVYIADFGLAINQTSSSQFCRGTRAYMSPGE
jgi:serine/threonine protein kinase